MSSENGHGNDRSLGRERLAEIQRRRLIAAMVGVASESGADGVTVAGVVARSGVSRRTFYELFEGAEDCLLVAIDESLARARSYVLDAYDPQETWRIRIRAALRALLRFLEDEPARGRLLVVGTFSAGPKVFERRSRVLAQLIAAVDEGRQEAKGGSEPTPLTAEGVVGGALSVIHARLLQGARKPLIELANPLMSMIVLPYLGSAAARRELAQPLPKRERRRAPVQDGVDHLNGLPMRITYRTMCVLSAIASQPGASNARIGKSAGIADQGQMSKLLHRLERLGLAANSAAGQPQGTANAWTLTSRGAQVERASGLSPKLER